MRSIHILGGLTALSSLSSCQVLSWCRDDKCADCISGITSAGSGYPTCAIYDTETVFGGQGFQPGVGGKFLYKVHGNFPDPCEGYPGNIMIRSPASLTDLGCGNLIFQTKNAQCSTGLDLRDTFMVQFCCGADHCEAAGVPWGRRALGGPTARAAAAAGTQGVMLMFPNGTVIPPIAVGYPPHTRRVSARQCKGYQANSYVSNGEPYLKTFDTQIVSGSVPARTNATVIVVTYQQSYAVSTGFDIGIGDPFGIISAKVSFTFTNTNTKIEQFNVPVPVGDVGQMGFTPVYKCTKGTLKLCDGSVTPEQESCTPWVVDGVQQGDYEMILT